MYGAAALCAWLALPLSGLWGLHRIRFVRQSRRASGLPPCDAKRRTEAAGSVPRDGYKRPFDLACVAVIGVALAPVWLAVWILVPLAIRLEDGGRVLYVQRRVGRHGRAFDIIKFRTMVEDAERLTGPVLASAEDSRTTRVGRVLRRFHLDELPQVLNILKGDMSLVGPRPERPELIEKIKLDVPGFASRFDVRPGVAGLAQARGSYHSHPRDKLRYDRLYIQTMTPLLDLKLIALCSWKALRRLLRRRVRRPAA